MADKIFSMLLFVAAMQFLILSYYLIWGSSLSSKFQLRHVLYTSSSAKDDIVLDNYANQADHFADDIKLIAEYYGMSQQEFDALWRESDDSFKNHTYQLVAAASSASELYIDEAEEKPVAPIQESATELLRQGKTFIKKKYDIIQAQERHADLNRLKFVHITKTGGTAIIQAAFEQKGQLWGEYDQDRLAKYDRVLGNMHPLALETWHTPIRRFLINPYSNYSTFAVVRNPYARMVSEFNWIGFESERKKKKIRDIRKSNGMITEEENVSVKTLNEWTIKKLKRLRRKGFVCRAYCGHMLPQSDFLFNQEGHLVVDHVLRYENLHDDFVELMNLYEGDRVHLLPKNQSKVNAAKYHFTTDDLTQEAKDLIYDFFKVDFKSLGYKHYE